MADIPVRVIIDAVDNASKEMQGFGKSLDGVAGQMRTVGAAGAAVGAITLALATGFVQQAGAMEQNQVAFETMLGSATKAKDLLQQMSDFAARTPFNLPDIVNAGKQLLAYGFEQKEVIKTTEMLGNVAAGLNIPMGDIIYLFGTLRAQGRAYTKDLNQFTARGIPILDALAKQYGVTKSAVFDLASEGKIGFEDVNKAFQTMTSSGGLFFNLMDKQSKTTLGTWSNFQDSITRVQIALGNALLPALNEVMNALMPVIQRFGEWAKNNPELVKNLVIAGLAIGAIGTVLLAIGVIIPPIIAAVTLIGGALAALGVALGWVEFFGWLVVAVLGGPITIAIVAVGAAVALLTVAWNKNWGDIQGKTRAVISAIVGGFKAFIDILSSLGKYFMAVFEDGDYFNDWLSHLPDVLQGPVAAIGHFIQIIKGVGAVIVDFFTGGDVTATWYQYFRMTFMGIAIFLDNFRYQVLSLPETIAAVGTAISGFFQALPGVISSALSAAGQAIYGFFTSTLPYAIGFAAGAIVKFFTVDIPGAWNTLVTFLTVTIPTFLTNLTLWIVGALTMALVAIVQFATVDVPNAFFSMINWMTVNIPIMWNSFVQWILNMSISALNAVTSFINQTVVFFQNLWKSIVAIAIGIYSDVVSWFTQTTTDSIKAVTGLPAEIERVFNNAKDSAVNKAKEIYDGVKGWFDQIIKFFKDIISFADTAIQKAGQAASAGFNAGKRQYGGPVSAASGYVVGEAGAEGFTPQTAGYITPHGAYAGRGQGNGGTVQFIINASTIINSANERRNLAEALYKDLVTLARSQKMTVAELLGG